MKEWQAILYDQHFFLVEPRIFLKISYFAQFWKFSSELWHVISNYTYQQVIHSNMGSKMAPLMVFRGAGACAPEKQMKIKLKYMKAKEMHIKMI